MAYLPQRSQSLFTTLTATFTDYWHEWRATCDRAIINYYNQRIEQNPEGEAQQYWNRLKHPLSGIDVQHISDRMLSRLMQSLLEQGISKFAADQFILELRRLTRTVQ